MSSENNSLKQIMGHRLEKLGKIKNAGINPFPYKYSASHKISKILCIGYLSGSFPLYI